MKPNDVPGITAAGTPPGRAWIRRLPSGLKVLLRGRVGNPAFVQTVTQTLGAALPGPLRSCFGRTGAGILLWLAPTGWLVVAPEEEIARRLTDRFDGLEGDAIDVSDEYEILGIGGDPDALLESTCPCDLSLRRHPVGSVVRTLVAGIPAIIFRQAEDVVLLLVDRSLCHHLVASLEAAAADLD